MFDLSVPELTGLGVVMFGGWSLAAYFMRLVYVGKLVPSSTLERVEHDRDEWRAEGRLKDQTIQELADQHREWLAIGHASEAVLNALPVPENGADS